MNAPVTSIEQTETARIESALDALLTAAIAARPVSPPRGPELAGVVVGRVLDSLRNHTPAQIATDELLDNPVGEATRQAIRKLGKRLHEIGGTKLMQDVLDRVANRAPQQSTSRTDIMDKRWDGIGDWFA